MAAQSWYNGQVSFGGTTLGGTKTAELNITVPTAPTNTTGSTANTTIALNRIAGTMTITGLETDANLDDIQGVKDTLIILESDGSTAYSGSCRCMSVAVTRADEAAHAYNATFNVEALPSVPDLSHISSIST